MKQRQMRKSFSSFNNNFNVAVRLQFSLDIVYGMRIYNKERGASLPPVPHSEGLRIALFVETSNDGSPTWMRKYMIPLNASCAK